MILWNEWGLDQVDTVGHPTTTPLSAFRRRTGLPRSHPDERIDRRWKGADLLRDH